ncbi:carboxylesterase NlhH-like [Anneissia japonica]|uniref:carboxylesterase NlhH-like n=1 Tax=Anneissia japonica TaxID=1529436 RepID=UPI001425A2FB|nr:carboxylesterase NlhH-like [Anneissia japonica]XP_033104398.1 carboxylesterase NlhH-like [Anneissia japonica]
MGKYIIAFMFIGLATAFYFYTPVPDDLENPWRFRLGHIALRVLHSLLYFSTKYSDGTLALRVSRILPHPPDGDHHSVMVTSTEFDGVPVKLFQPQLRVPVQDQVLPAIVYFHGGGFVFGNPEFTFGITKRMCEELQAVVASVDYRLAPEHKFPAAFEDALKVTKWFLLNAKQYNVNASKVAVAGDSAGGLLSAAVSQFIKDDTTVPDLLFQGLIYPSTQQIDLQLPSAQQYHSIFGNKGVLCRHDIAMFIGLYIFGEFRQDYYDAYLNCNLTSREFRETSHLMQYIDHDVILKSDFQTRYYIKPQSDPDNRHLWEEIKDIVLDVRMSPLLRVDMRGLPPAWVATCEYDPIRDDGILYANRLQKAGVPVKLTNYEGGFHGVWLSDVGLQVYEQMMNDFLVFAKEYINHE